MPLVRFGPLHLLDVAHGSVDATGDGGTSELYKRPDGWLDDAINRFVRPGRHGSFKSPSPAPAHPGPPRPFQVSPRLRASLRVARQDVPAS